MEKDIKFGIIGCGHIGKQHAAVIDEAQKATLVSLGDIEVVKANELGGLYEINSVYADYQELINSDVDVMSICTPHFLHKPMTINALKAGKDVVVEKPMALSASDAQETTSTAKQLKRKLYVVKQNRYNVPIRLAGEAIFNNKRGNFMVECNVM
jgi:UDP-N-acetyl-2-amino-2-deoxyglucuronate dehydrogenase